MPSLSARMGQRTVPQSGQIANISNLNFPRLWGGARNISSMWSNSKYFKLELSQVLGWGKEQFNSAGASAVLRKTKAKTIVKRKWIMA